MRHDILFCNCTDNRYRYYHHTYITNSQALNDADNSYIILIDPMAEASSLEPASQVHNGTQEPLAGVEAEESGTTYSLENVVVLKADPLSLPMVCGLCGNQYATARGKLKSSNICTRNW